MQVDINRLTQLSHSSKEAKLVFDRFLQRRRARSSTDIKRLYLELSKQHRDLQESLIQRLFSEFEALGLGKAERGPKGLIKRFNWSYHLVSIAKAALGSADLKQFRAKDRRALPKIVTYTDTIEPELGHNYKIIIRKGSFEVSTEIPTNTHELEKLIELVTKLK